MNIKGVSEKTNLTKRAIKYYEDEGLINSIKDSDNNYREYSEKDIIKLNLIGTLRAVDISIIEIKDVIEGGKSIPDVMKETLHRILVLNNADFVKSLKVLLQFLHLYLCLLFNVPFLTI